MKTYYIVMVDGIPEGVSANYQRAKEMMKQMASRNREATILPCTPAQTEFDFMDEEPTAEDCFCKNE